LEIAFDTSFEGFEKEWNINGEKALITISR